MGLIDRVAAVILAGGQGTRLFPLTQHRCKPAVGFGGRYRLIDIPISNALNSKVPHFFVISQYFASSLHQHILATYRPELFQNGSMELLCPEESRYRKAWFEGTADAVRQNIDYLLKAPVDYYLILSGDQLYNIDFNQMIEFADQTQAEMVVGAIEVGRQEAQRMGVMLTDQQHHIQKFVEKPKDPLTLDQLGKNGDRFCASMGIYVFRRDALQQLLQEDGLDFGHHLIPKQVQRGNAYAYPYQGYWVDIGTIASFYQANMALLDRSCCLDVYDEDRPIFTRPYTLPSPLIQQAVIRHSLISQGTIVEGGEVDHSVLGMRTHVKQGTTIRNSILMGNHFYKPPLYQSLPTDFSIGEGCVIDQAIIDEHTKIGNGVVLVNHKGKQNWEGDGIYIRDGIIIVPTGVEIPDHYTL